MERYTIQSSLKERNSRVVEWNRKDGYSLHERLPREHRIAPLLDSCLEETSVKRILTSQAVNYGYASGRVVCTEKRERRFEGEPPSNGESGFSGNLFSLECFFKTKSIHSFTNRHGSGSISGRTHFIVAKTRAGGSCSIENNDFVHHRK